MKEFLINVEDEKWFNSEIPFEFRQDVKEWLDIHCKNRYSICIVDDHNKFANVCIIFSDDRDYTNFVLYWV